MAVVARWCLVLTAGNVNDTVVFALLIDALRVPRRGRGRPRTRPDYLLADKGYSSRANRGLLRRRGIAHTIPEPRDQQANRARRGSAGGRPVGFDSGRYRRRNIVERGFASSNTGGDSPPATTNTPATTSARFGSSSGGIGKVIGQSPGLVSREELGRNPAAVVHDVAQLAKSRSNLLRLLSRASRGGVLRGGGGQLPAARSASRRAGGDEHPPPRLWTRCSPTRNPPDRPAARAEAEAVLLRAVIGLDKPTPCRAGRRSAAARVVAHRGLKQLVSTSATSRGRPWSVEE
jgi:transposase